jgi:hypothetical protein
MFDRLSDDDISKALAELITCFGVREDRPLDDLVALLRKKDTEGCVQAIATRLGLPIRINLSFVPKDFRPGSTDKFYSSALSRTDWTGRGIEGIVAQVSIPQNLPMFGTTGLQHYPIRVRVSENCHAYPATFVAIMAHELSHVLLASLRHPQKDSELHTDLVPILLGFRGIVRRGRRTIESTTNVITTTTRTTTYGYLTDSHFEFACRHVTGILKCHQGDKKHLIDIVKQVQRKLKKAERRLATFRDYYKYLDRQPPDKMREEHAQRLVQLHTRDYSREWEIRITAVTKSLAGAESFVRHLSHYTSGAVDHLKTHTRSLELASDDLSQVTEVITEDISILHRYVDLIHKLRRTLWHRQRL